MQLVTVVEVRPDDYTAPLAMMRRFNEACNWLADVAFQERIFSWLPLQRRAYHELRERYGLGGIQATVAIRKVAATYKNKARRSTLATFSPLGGIPLHRHSYRPDGTVRIYGSVYPYRARPGVTLPRNVPQGVLVYRDNRFFVQQPLGHDVTQAHEPNGFLGVDLGIVNIAADSDGETHAGAAVNGMRHRADRLRTKLQRKGTKSARRLLVRRRQQEGRFARDVNHCISKNVVAKALGTGRGIALEDLKGIRDRTTVRRAHRHQHASWSFAQLRAFIEYKSALAGVPVVAVDPRNTSRTCPECGNVDKRNRPSQSVFRCRGCGFGGPADTIAARNIARRADSDRPHAAPSGELRIPSLAVAG